MPSAPPIGAARIQSAIEKVAGAIARRHKGSHPPTILGVANGGLVFASRLAKALGAKLRTEIPTGVLDISFYRDDIGVRPIPKVFTPTDVPGAIDGGHFIIADDVLHSGRTIRAALEELFAQGRPALVELAVLVDRGGRTLPIHADYSGIVLKPGNASEVRVILHPQKPSSDRITLRKARA